MGDFVRLLEPEGIIDLGKRFTREKVVGETSGYQVSADDTHIPEVTLMHDIDAHGNEPAMFGRMVKGSVMRSGNMFGLTKPIPTERYLLDVTERGIPATAIVAENSALTHDVPNRLRYLRQLFGSEVNLVTVRGVKGQYADHLVDENVNVLATGIALGTRR